MTAIASHLSGAELEARYETAGDPISKSHFHAIWLLSSGHAITDVAAILSFSARWVRLLVKRYNEHGPDSLGDRRLDNGAPPAILTPDALSSLKERLKTPPDDGGLWTGPKVARWLARFHGLKPCTISAAGTRLLPSTIPSRSRGRAIPSRRRGRA